MIFHGSGLKKEILNILKNHDVIIQKAENIRRPKRKTFKARLYEHTKMQYLLLDF